MIEVKFTRHARKLLAQMATGREGLGRASGIEGQRMEARFLSKRLNL